MARLQKALSIMVVVLSCLFVLSASLLEDYQGDLPGYNAPAAPPVPNHVLPREQAPRYFKFLNNCFKNRSENMTSKCGAEIYASIVEDGRLSFDCCDRLVDFEFYRLSFDCFFGLAKLIKGFPEVKPIKSKILPRRKSIWYDCYYRLCPTCNVKYL